MPDQVTAGFHLKFSQWLDLLQASEPEQIECLWSIR